MGKNFKKPRQEKLSPYWVTGIVDAEGNFSINKQKVGDKYKFSLAFKVTQKEHSLGILYDLKNFFNCGHIHVDNKKENAYKYNVAKLDDIIKIILPHFDKYPLVTSKNLDFLDFKRVALLKNKLSLDEILCIKNNMNSKRSFTERWNFYNNKKIILVNEWVQAFIDGEGSFQFNISKTVNRKKPYIAYTPNLSISQSSYSIKILKAIIEFFGVGYLKPKYDITDIDICKSIKISRCIINQYSVVTKFMDKYPMFTRKHLDYLAWKELIKLKKDKEYKTREGKLLIENIKASMNSGRK
jgi:LAGLIDADG endonuclease